jgi:hypothetical protein
MVPASRRREGMSSYILTEEDRLRLVEAMTWLRGCMSLAGWEGDWATLNADAALSLLESFQKTEAVSVPAEEALEQLESFDTELATWAKAYPLTVFPEPDFRRAQKALERDGMTLDSVSASNMRYVVTTLNDSFEPIRAALSTLRELIEKGKT